MDRFFLFFLLILFSCNMPNNPEANEDVDIDYYQIDFNEDTNNIYVALKIINYEIIDTITSELYNSDSINYIFTLNDNGLNGDILPQDGLFSILENLIDFEYGQYYLKNKLIDIYGNILDKEYSINILENNPPLIVEIQIPETFYLDSLNWTNLNISLSIFDNDGLIDIDHVRYLVNTDFLTKDDPLTEECDHYYLSDPDEENYSSDPSWFMEYNETLNDTIHKYITSIPMRPSVECGGYGIVLFSFIVTDKNGDSSQESDIIIEIISCGDGVCNNEEDCNSCSSDCGVCDE